MSEAPVSAWVAFWRTLTKLERNKIIPGIAFRNAIAVALPMAIGIAIHQPLGGVAVTTGALNVSYSDGTDPYKSRARRMLIWTLLGGLAVFVGSATGHIGWLAILVAAAWAFLAGLGVAISSKTGDLGLNTLVAVIVFAARGAMDWKGAAAAGALVIVGGLLQMSLALLFWPIRPDSPERRVLGKVYIDLGDQLDPAHHDLLEGQLHSPNQQIADTLAALGQDHSVESERFRVLFDQADRLRRSTFVLQRLLLNANLGEGSPLARAADQLLVLSTGMLRKVGEGLSANASDAGLSTYKVKLDEALESGLAQARDPKNGPLAEDIGKAMDVLAGQLRIVLSLAGHSTEEGDLRLSKEESTRSWQLNLGDTLEILKANLTWESTYFRHAVRMCVSVALGDQIARIVFWQRAYWLPMTVAVVLKPDFTTTFSRGILRFAGTFAGLVLATLLYHLLPVSSPLELALSQLFLVGLFTFALRSVGAANYGVFSVSISGLIVFLVAATGVSPGDVVVERALNTAAGGLLALLLYAAWPTWERTQVNELLAQMLDAARDYFRAVAKRLCEDEADEPQSLEKARNNWRRVRSNVEVSVDRMSAEPGASTARVTACTGMLASSHALVHAVAGLDASLIQKPRITQGDAFAAFARDVEFTLYFLAAALHNSKAAFETLPQLREDHRRIVESRNRFSNDDTLLVTETDRLVVSLNTLREQVLRYIAI